MRAGARVGVTGCVYSTCAGKPVIDELQDAMESRGMTATLLCRSHGNPAPTITFRRLRPPTDTVYRTDRLYVSDNHPADAAEIARHAMLQKITYLSLKQLTVTRTALQHLRSICLTNGFRTRPTALVLLRRIRNHTIRIGFHMQ